MAMPKKTVILYTKEQSEWCDFLKEFFEDAPITLHILSNPQDFSSVDQHQPDLLLTDEKEWRLSQIQKLKVYKQSRPDFRLVLLGIDSKNAPSDLSVDAFFLEPPSFVQFQKELVNVLPLPETIRVLITDDEVEIGHAIRDYLDHRVNPTFEVRYVENGEKALKAIDEKVPDVMILDIKMPIMTGQEVYREIVKRDLGIAIIMFFDAITGNEVSELHRSGKPVIIDKGSEESSMPNLLALVKKMAYFKY